MEQNVNNTGVIVPEEAVRGSEEKKRQHRTVRQTQVYRDMANLKFLVARYMGKSPRRYAKFFDTMLLTVSNGKQSLAMGLTGHDAARKAEDISYAQVMVEDIQDDAVILFQLGVLSKSEKKALRRLAQNISAQIVRLRDYFSSQGIDINGNTSQQ